MDNMCALHSYFCVFDKAMMILLSVHIKMVAYELHSYFKYQNVT